MNIKKAIEKLDELYSQMTLQNKLEMAVSPYVLREILLALDEKDEFVSVKTHNNTCEHYDARFEDIERRVGELEKGYDHGKMMGTIYDINTRIKALHAHIKYFEDTFRCCENGFFGKEHDCCKKEVVHDEGKTRAFGICEKCLKITHNLSEPIGATRRDMFCECKPLPEVKAKNDKIYKRLMDKVGKPEDTITIPRSVAEEWYRAYSKCSTDMNELINMIKAIKSALAIIEKETT